ncbi:MAG: AgmX/PglI C-terminal domain-containing protein [Polyangiaceae bacterium]|nr:AgmX/PglI C-terminal domain-containing protein [Polyangiaceae bacterium]
MPGPVALPEPVPDGAPFAATEAQGHLPQEQIQRIVRERFDVFRECYDDGLRRNPYLEGRVSVRFVIDRQGRVPLAEPTADTNLPAPSVVACVVKGYRSLTFPKPVGGIVTVIYPMFFTPGDD